MMRGNFNANILDEIALEGLDGITTKGLWERLSTRLKVELPFPPQFKNRIWEVVRRLIDVEIYELPEPRDFFIFDRYKYIDNELGMVLDPEVDPPMIYPYFPIDENGIRGSCKTYRTRVNRTADIRKLSISEIEEQYNDKIVFVASQQERYCAMVDNNQIVLLTTFQYNMLERIARSRHHGEITLGKVSLQDMGETPKSLFYHRKALLQYKLIVKQAHQHKIGGSNNCGSLLHLPRFYVERKPKIQLTAEKIVEILKEKPNFSAIYDEIRLHFTENSGLKKICKTAEFQRIIRTDVKLRYREVYPDADQNEWMLKSGEERIIRSFQLIDPNIDLAEVWTKEEVDDEEEHGFINADNIIIDMPLMMHAFRVIAEYGNKGITQNELASRLGQHKLNARAICRHLVRTKCVIYFMDNIGRQRVTKFMSKRFLKNSQIEHIYSERNKIIQAKNKNKNEITENNSTEIEGKDVTNKRKRKKPQATNVAKKPCIDTSNVISDEEDPNTANSHGEMIFSNVDKNNIETKIYVTKEVPGLKISSLSLTDNPKSGKADFRSTITYRFLKRANLIIKLVREEKLINDLAKLMRLINEEEDKEGYHTKIDKKSLMRLILKVSQEEHIKILRVSLKLDQRKKNLIFLCEPNILPDHTLIKSEIERAKMKYFIAFTATVNIKSVNQQQIKMESNSKPDVERIKALYKSSEGRRFGYSPKFVRMRLLHELLFYCIYEHATTTFTPVFTKEEAVQMWRTQSIPIDDTLLEEVPSFIYGKEFSWKMFIPPLPGLREWPNGWAIMCDILHRIPVSIFVKIVNVSYDLPDLQTYLQHPIKKHLLVKYLPSHLRDIMLYRRRYVFSIHQIVMRLCFIGVVQFGPQRFKDKDQLFIYLNRNASVWDTRTSDRGYHQVSEQEYQVKFFKFYTLSDVETYWYELWNICVHTNLGVRNALPVGQDIVLELLDTKPAMLESTKAREPEEAIAKDKGLIPGDHKGAGGLDCSIFAHYKRNWSWLHPKVTNKNAINTGSQVKAKLKARLDQLKRKPLNYKDISTKVARPKVIKKIFQPSDFKVLQSIKRKPKTSVRKVLPRKKNQRKPVYDDIDKEALKLMNKLRVDWSPEEDRILLLSKVAFLFLGSTIKVQNFICFQNVRDCLHRLQGSRNKTSRACQRRIHYMMKNPLTQKSVALCLEEIRQCPDIRAVFQNYPVKKVNVAFVVLLNVLMKKFNNITNNNQVKLTLSDTILECNEKFDIYVPRAINGEFKYSMPDSVADIQANVLQSAIHSAMCCPADKTYWNFQIFKVYQMYPENMLRSVLTNIRKNKLISMKRTFVRRKMPLGNLPLTNSPYQLSVTYRNKLITKHPYAIFYESFLKVTEIKKAIVNPLFEYISVSGGSAAALFEMFIKHDLSFTIEIPEQVIILDPSIDSTVDSTYTRVCKRYEEILKSVPLTSQAVDPFDDDKDDMNIPIKSLSTTNDTEPQTVIIKSSSRIALYMMRGELIDSLEDKSSTQHMHDFFVVNSSRIFLKATNEELCSIPSNKCKRVLEEIQRRATISTERPDFNQIPYLLKELDATTEDVEFCYNLVSFILKYGQLGVPSFVLEKHFADCTRCSFTLPRMLTFLCNENYILKCGIVSIIYVHYDHIQNWVINSIKIKRLEREQMGTTIADISKYLNNYEKILPPNEKNTPDICSTNDTPNNDETNQMEVDEPVVNTLESSTKLVEELPAQPMETEDYNTNLVIGMEKTEPIENPDILNKEESNSETGNSRVASPENTSDINRPAPKSLERVRVNITPWVRVDGSINRRVLDRWLGSILSYCIDQPGITICQICNRFQFLKPFDIKTLLEYLEMLDCIKFFKLKKERISLFKKSRAPILLPASGLEDFSEILVETNPISITKLGTFIGDKQYKNDFLDLE